MFVVGETPTLAITVKDLDKALTSPATSMTVTIKGPTKTTKVAAGAMTEDSTGKYSYKYTIDDGPGKYYVLYVGTDGTDIGKAKDEFSAEAED